MRTVLAIDRELEDYIFGMVYQNFDWPGDTLRGVVKSKSEIAEMLSLRYNIDASDPKRDEKLSAISWAQRIIGEVYKEPQHETS